MRSSAPDPDHKRRSATAQAGNPQNICHRHGGDGAVHKSSAQNNITDFLGQLLLFLHLIGFLPIFGRINKWNSSGR